MGRARFPGSSVKGPAVVCVSLFGCFVRGRSCQGGFRSLPSGRSRFAPRTGRSVGARRKGRGAGSGGSAVEPRVVRRLRCGASSRRSGHRRAPRRRLLTLRREGRQGVRPVDVRGLPGHGHEAVVRGSPASWHPLSGQARPRRTQVRCGHFGGVPAAFPQAPRHPTPPRSAPARHPCPRCASPRHSRRAKHSEFKQVNSHAEAVRRSRCGCPDRSRGADRPRPRRPRRPAGRDVPAARRRR
jgi:hypothetical protein